MRKSEATKNSGASEPVLEPAPRILRERHAKWPKGKKYEPPLEPEIERLPLLPPGWIWATVDTLLTAIEAGKSFRCDPDPPGPNAVGVVKVSAVTWGVYQENESKTCTDSGLINPDYFIAEGDFLFSRANTIELVGACVIVHAVTRRIMLSDKILRFRLADETWDRWLLYCLRSAHGRKQIERLATGNQDSMRNIGQDRIRQIPIPIPPLAERHQIIGEIEKQFTRLDAAVSTLERSKANLMRARASVLAAAVAGRLVPTEAELARVERREYEPASALLARILDERKARCASGKKYKTLAEPETTGMPELPGGWVWASSEQLASGVDHGLAIGPFGSNLKVSDYRNQGVPLIFVRNIRSGDFDLEQKYVDAEKAAELRSHQCRPGDVLITKMGDPPGDSWVYPGGRPIAVITADVVKWTIHEELGLPWFFAYATRAPVVRKQVLGKTQGVAQKKVSLNRFRGIVYPLPPLAEQVRIVAEVERRFSILDRLESALDQSLARCKQLRQSILKRALEGKLVPQDPNDEPASALLERFSHERSQYSRQ